MTTMPTPEDEITQEGADAHRLIQAGLANKDQETVTAGTRRAFRLVKKTGMPLNETTAKILGLDKLPKLED